MILLLTRSLRKARYRAWTDYVLNLFRVDLTRDKTPSRRRQLKTLTNDLCVAMDRAFEAHLRGDTRDQGRALAEVRRLQSARLAVEVGKA